MPYGNGSLVCGNVHVVRDGHIPAKRGVPLLGDIDRDTFLGLNIVRNLNIAVATVQHNASTGIQFSVIPDDEVPGTRSLFIGILSGRHRDITGYRGCFALNIDGSKVGSDSDVIIRLYRFLIRRIFDTDVDFTLTRLYRYISILGLDGSGNEDAALVVNIRNDIAFFGNNVARKMNISVSLHIETGFISRLKQSFILRQFADADASSI